MNDLSKQTDQAWACIKLPASRDWLRFFLNDDLRFFRCNPYYEIRRWQTADGQSAEAFVSLFNQTNEQSWHGAIRIENLSTGKRFYYGNGLKAFTQWCLTENGLEITEDYGRLSEQERRLRIKEVDKSLIPWLLSIQFHVKWRRRLSWIPKLNTILDRYWMPIRPSTRRICTWLILLSIAELIVFSTLILVYLVLRV